MLKNNGDFEKVMKEVIELDEKRWKWIGRKDNSIKNRSCDCGTLLKLITARKKK